MSTNTYTESFVDVQKSYRNSYEAWRHNQEHNKEVHNNELEKGKKIHITMKKYR
jgi:hypothetical protein